jgi:beta-galactosidase GanA
MNSVVRSGLTILVLTCSVCLAHAQMQHTAPPQNSSQNPPVTGDALMDSFGLTSTNKVQTNSTVAPPNANPKVIPLKGDTSFLMSAFPSTSQNKLSLFTSYDGTSFAPLASEAYTPPQGLLRDPSILHADDGYYYVIYTTGWAGDTFGVAKSSDLRHWQHVRDVHLQLPDANAKISNVWAPEWFTDSDGTVHIVVSISTQGTKGPFGAYVLHALDKTYANFSPAQAMAGLQNNYIDTFPIKDGSRYVVFTKNETSKYIEMATAPALAGPWKVEKTGDWAGWGKPSEGQALVKLKNGGWRIYFDDYTTKHYWYSDSKDNFKTWTAKQELGGVSGAVRHFTVISEPTKVLEQAIAAKTPAKKITWDKHSLMIDGKREMIWAGEFHPFRLPNPSLWRDVIQKMKATGLNTVAIYFDWGYHSSRPNQYDFSSIRNVELAIEMAEQEGMYVIARPGPYVNAELTLGGFPGYLARQKAIARTDAAEYMQSADEWLTQIDAIIARHQITTGGGTVIAYQLENELSNTSDTHKRYMQHLADKARADGISVPLFHNSAGRLPNWTPPNSSAPYAVPGPTDLYSFDGYPGGGCTNTKEIGKPNVVPNWGMYGEIPANTGTGPVKIGALASPNTPGFAAEMGGGWFDFWGSVGTYDCTAQRTGSNYVRTFYGANLINGISIHSIYMMYGGTSWGWLPAQVVYTSYDYGAAIDEGRGLREKALTLKQMGHFVEAAKSVLSAMDKGEAITTSNPAVRLYHNISPVNGSHLIFAIHTKTDSTTEELFSFKLTTRDGSYQIPQAGTLRIKDQNIKLLLSDYAMERQHLVYTTSDTQTHLQQDERDIALLYGRKGEDGETVLRYQSQPKVEVLEGATNAVFDQKTGDLRLNYVHKDLIRVRISGGGKADLLLLLADDETGRNFWRQETAHGAVLERSPALVRQANVQGNTLHLSGDTHESSKLDIWAPKAVTQITWNTAAISSNRNADGSLSTEPLAGPADIVLPKLMQQTWMRRMDSPEAAKVFDDSKWRKTDLTTTAATVKTTPPAGQPILSMSDYGFHHGDVWYRGNFNILAGKPLPEQLEISYGGGGAGFMQLWLDGVYIGENEMPTGKPKPDNWGTASFKLPTEALHAGEHVLSVMVRNNSHNWDLAADDEHKVARGLISASLTHDIKEKFSTPITWKIQGNKGGEEIADLVRGPMNNGGLYGERTGWYLPVSSKAESKPDNGGWEKASPDAAPPAAGTYWLRTNFTLDMSAGHDVQLGLAIGDTSQPRSDRRNRVLIFVNGWNMGNFISHIGPQRLFILPPGILNPNGENTLTLAVSTDGKAANALEPLELVKIRAARGGAPLELVPSPSNLQR